MLTNKKSINKTQFLSTLIIILLILFTGRESFSAKRPKVAVFGFKSIILNNMQDRVLREELLRILLKKKYAIIPVMELESIFIDKPGKIRTLKWEKIVSISRDHKCDFAITGAISPSLRKHRHKYIVKKRKYICSITIYNSGTKKFSKRKITIYGKENFSDFIKILSKKIIMEFESIL